MEFYPEDGEERWAKAPLSKAEPGLRFDGPYLKVCDDKSTAIKQAHSCTMPAFPQVNTHVIHATTHVRARMHARAV